MSARTALVTGASRGIGLGIARRLADRGAALTITARDQQRLEDVAEELRGRGAAAVLPVSGDLSAADDCVAVVEAHRATYQNLDALILNAGMGSAGALDSVPLRRVRAILDVNLVGPLLLIQAALPQLRMAAAARPADGAKVIAMSSITGVHPEPGLGGYAASKAALLSLVDTFNLEESGGGVVATAVSPAYVDTDMTSWLHDEVPPAHMLPTSDVVHVVEMLLALSPKAVVGNIVVARAGTDGRRP